MKKAMQMIPSRNELITVEGAGHDLGFKGKSRNDELPSRIVEAFRRLNQINS
jgi:hypothetical protein